MTYGPGGVLFLARWPQNELGQTKPGSATTDKMISLTALGVESSLASMQFVPPGQPGSGSLKLASYRGGAWYDADVVRRRRRHLRPGQRARDRDSRIDGGPEGFVYVTSGSPQFSGPSLLVSEYGVDEVAAYQVDANGDPVIATRRPIITGLDGAEGALLDPVTGDFLFSTFGGGSRVVAVRGFRAPPPPLPPPQAGKTVNAYRRARHGSRSSCRPKQVRRARGRGADPGRLDRRRHEGPRDDRRGGRPVGRLLRRHLQDRPEPRREAADDAHARREAALPERRASASAAAKRKKKRKLWGDGSGNFKTEGKHSAATVVGTKWLVEDRCASRRTRVVTGVVSVRDFGKRKTVRVRAGKKYVAKAR